MREAGKSGTGLGAEPNQIPAEDTRSDREGPTGRLLAALYDLKPGDHICSIYETDEEHRALLTPYMRLGLERNEKVLYIVDARTAQTVLGYLRDDGVAIDGYLDRGQFAILTPADSYSRDGVFNPDAMIDLLRIETDKALAEGYSALRVTGEMSWALRGIPGSERLVEYEAKLNRFFPGSKALAVCQYDRRRFSPSLLLEVLARHPIAVVGTEVYENIYYLPPEALLGTDRDEARLRSTLENLREFRKSEEALGNQVILLESLLEAIPAPVFYKDIDHIYLGCNEAFAKFLGLPKDKIVGKSVYDVAAKDLADVYREKDDELFRNPGTQVYETVVKYADGTAHDVILHKATFEGSHGAVAGLIGVLLDITWRKRAEDALKERELELAGILAASPVGIARVDERRIRWANEALLRMFGAESEEDYLGKESGLIYESDEEYERVGKVVYEGIRSGTRAETDARFKRLDGSIFDGHIKISAPDPSRPTEGTIAVITDISERKQAEEKLRVSEKRYRTLFEISTDAILIARPEGEIIDANQACAELFGANVHEVIGANVLRFYADPRDRDLFLRAMDRDEFVKDFEFTVRRKDGSLRYCLLNSSVRRDKDGNPVGYFGILRDVSQQRHLQEERVRLTTAIEQAAEAVVITDTKGTIQYVNPAFERTTGFTKEEVLGGTPLLLRSGKHDKEFYDEMWRTINSGKVWTGHFINKKKDGSFYEEAATISPVMNAAGELVNFVAVKRDVTNEVLLEKQLRQAQKMESIGTLAGGIAHDFNNLLTVIMGYTELLLADSDEATPGHAELKTVLHATKRGADLVKRILTFSRRVETHLRPVNLNDELKHAAKLLSRTIPKMIEIEINPAEDLKTVNADPGQIEQALLNLAVNARDAMPHGGTFTIATANVVLDEEYCKTQVDVKPGEYVLLNVSDTGHGMERDVIERIFEPFYTTKALGEGTGLGLAMVFGIVKAHGGQITCYSEPGVGTTFRIYLPTIESESGSGTATSGRMTAFGTETILIVDDEEPIRQLGERILSRAGYKVLTARNGVEALKVYLEQKDAVSLVILDLIMPGMAGWECLAELLGIDPDLKVLVATGFFPGGIEKKDLARDAKGFISKPFNMRELLNMVRKVLDEE